MRLLITGSTGFIGKYLVPRLIEEKHQVLEVTRNREKSEMLFGMKTQKCLIDDDQEYLKSQIETFNPEIVIHLASHLTSEDNFETQQLLINANIIFYCRILDALKNAKIRLFINTGTFAEYYNDNDAFEPAYLYAATKTASRAFLDYYSRVYNFKQATVVPYTIYGRKDTSKKIIDIIFDSINSGNALDLSPGEQVLDFIHIDDVVNFYLCLVEKHSELPQKINFQLGTGIGHTLRQLTKMIEEIAQRKTNINWGGRPYRVSDIMHAVANLDKLQVLNWYPKIDIQTGIKDYLSTMVYQ